MLVKINPATGGKKRIENREAHTVFGGGFGLSSAC
jgi:hypothetical protein